MSTIEEGTRARGQEGTRKPEPASTCTCVPAYPRVLVPSFAAALLALATSLPAQDAESPDATLDRIEVVARDQLRRKLRLRAHDEVAVLLRRGPKPRLGRFQVGARRLRLLGAEVVPVTSGSATLKDAVNEAMRKKLDVGPAPRGGNSSQNNVSVVLLRDDFSLISQRTGPDCLTEAT